MRAQCAETWREYNNLSLEYNELQNRLAVEIERVEHIDQARSTLQRHVDEARNRLHEQAKALALQTSKTSVLRGLRASLFQRA